MLGQKSHQTGTLLQSFWLPFSLILALYLTSLQMLCLYLKTQLLSPNPHVFSLALGMTKALSAHRLTHVENRSGAGGGGKGA